MDRGYMDFVIALSRHKLTTAHRVGASTNRAAGVEEAV